MPPSTNIMFRTGSSARSERFGGGRERPSFKDCIKGTQPFCYCKNLRLIDCTMEDCDLAFEYSDVHADIKGGIDSVKNPLSGSITADGIGEIILGGAKYPCNADIRVRGMG